MSKPRISIGEIMYVRKPSHISITIAGLTTLAAVVLSGCGSPEHGADSRDYRSAIEQLAVRREQPDPLVQAQARGQHVYEHYCQICHGPEAQGNGFNAAMLDPPPRNFADEVFWSQTDEAHLNRIVSQGGKAGGKSVLMPAWGRTLDEQEIRDVIAFLRTVPELTRQAEMAEEAGEAATAE